MAKDSFQRTGEAETKKRENHFLCLSLKLGNHAEAGGAVGFASVVTDQIRSCINMIDIGEKWRPASDYESYQRF